LCFTWQIWLRYWVLSERVAGGRLKLSYAVRERLALSHYTGAVPGSLAGVTASLQLCLIPSDTL
jgi:hypothetical protein